jgi:hypothetical protein
MTEQQHRHAANELVFSGYSQIYGKFFTCLQVCSLHIEDMSTNRCAGYQAEAMETSRGTPYCLLWRPMPFITWIYPFAGHIGICDSAGELQIVAVSRKDSR